MRQRENRKGVKRKDKKSIKETECQTNETEKHKMMREGKIEGQRKRQRERK